VRPVGIMTQAAPFGFSKVVFLSHVISDGAPVFPGYSPVELRQIASIERDGYDVQSITMGEQAGTHWARTLRRPCSD
jgi:kynurenine formamidase